MMVLILDRPPASEDFHVVPVPVWFNEQHNQCGIHVLLTMGVVFTVVLFSELEKWLNQSELYRRG